MKKAKIYFITGTNTAGKSTIVPLLKNKLPKDFEIHDFDERGVPNNVDSKWRQNETKYWLSLATRNLKKNISTIVCGLTYPEEIYKFNKNKNIKIALLDISKKEITRRLKIRYSTPNKLKILKQVTKLSLDECIVKNISNAQKLRRQYKKYKCKKFNTYNTTKHKTVDKIIKWLH